MIVLFASKTDAAGAPAEGGVEDPVDGGEERVVREAPGQHLRWRRVGERRYRRGIPERHLIVLGEHEVLSVRDARAVDERPVAAPQIAEGPLAGDMGDARVLSRDVGLGEPQSACRPPPHQAARCEHDPRSIVQSPQDSHERQSTDMGGLLICF